MKNLAITVLAFLFLVISSNLFAQNVSINADGSLPDTSAMLDVSSTTKGFLLPRMTTTEQNAIVLPATGLSIFNTTLNSIMLNTGTPLSPVWSPLSAGAIDTSNIANFYLKVRSLFSVTAPITYSNGLIGITQSTTSTNGYLSSIDWNTFNNKQPAGSYLTGNQTITLSGDVTGSGTTAITTNVGKINGTSLASLATGILKNTAGTGVPSIAIATDFPTLNQNTTGSAATLTTGRTIAITGDLAYTSPAFNGSANVTAAGTLATVNANAGSFTNANITVNGKGLITAASNGTAGTVTNIATGYGLSGGPITSTGTIIVDSATLHLKFLALKDSVNSITGYTTLYQNSLKQNQLNGTGFVKATGTTISYDNSTYLTGNQTISFAPTGDVTGSTTGTTTIAPALVIGTNKVLNTMLAQMPTLTIKGNNTGGTANASDLTVAQVNAILPVFTSTLNGLVPFSGGSAGKVLHGDGTWKDTASASNSWSITGNSGTSYLTNFLGTTDNKSLRFRTNNTQGMILDSLGNASVGASTTTLDATNPEKFLVNAGTTSSVNAIVGKGSINSYLQLNIQNQSAGTNASSDVVATANNGNETSNYVDMGINGGSNTSGVMGVANDAYFYNLGQNLFIGTGTAAKSLIFMTGGTDSATNQRMRIDGNGNVGIGIAAPATALHVVKSNSGSNILTLENSSASGYSSADFLNNSGSLSGTFGYANAGTGGVFGGRDYFNSYGNDFLWTANSTSAAIFVKGSNSNVGIGTTTPATALHVYGTNPLTLTGVQLGTTTTADSVLTINSGTVQKLPISTFSTPSNSWSVNGNSGTTSTTNFIGTTDNKSFKIKTNNTQGILLDSLGNVGVGTTPTFDATNPEKFLVNAGTTSSVNAIVGKGSINSYLQLNIQNQSAGTSASSDVVATANNGNETSNYMDMGINGGSNTSGVMGVADDAYLYNIGQNLFIGTGTAAKSLIFMTGGTDSATNGRMRIDGNGNVGIGTSTFNGTNPERLLVDAGTSVSSFQNVIVGKGNTNSYAQLNIQNTKAGTNASSDVVATANNGDESVNYIDIGINSGSNTSSGVYGGVNTGYLFTTGNDFAIGNATASKNLLFFTGGTASGNERMRIDGSGNVGIGTTSPNSTLQNTGSFSQSLITKTGNYTANASDYTIVANNTAGVRTITLPTAVGITGRIYVIKKISSAAFSTSIATTSSQTIDGSTTATLSNQYDKITVQSDGSNWIVLSN